MEASARKALFKSKTYEYKPSNSELLLEDICMSFGTEMKDAWIEPDCHGQAILTRLSKPAIVGNWLLQFEFRKYSPFAWMEWGKAVKVFYKNRLPQLPGNPDIHVMQQDIWERVKDYDAVNEVLKPDYIPDLPIRRWYKAILFAIYNLNQSTPKSKTKSFHISLNLYPEFQPDIEGRFFINSYYAVNGEVKDTSGVYDELQVDSSGLEAHNKQMALAHDKHLANTIKQFAQHADCRMCKENWVFEVQSDVPRKVTIGMIQEYITRIIQNKLQ